MEKTLFNNSLIKFLSVCLLSVCTFKTNAQTAASYGFTPINAYFSELTSGTPNTLVQDDDQSSNMINIGFNFNFCGTSYNQLKVNSNGWVSFANTFPLPWEMSGNEDYFWYLPTFQPAIFALWDDQTGFNGTASYQLLGTAPERVFVIEWKNWEWYAYQSSATISYQVRLHESSNVIDVVYRQEPGALTTWFNESGTIGIATSNADFQTLSDWSTNPISSSAFFYTSIYDKPATGQLYRWAPPTNCSGMPNAGSAVAQSTTLACEGSTNLSLLSATLGGGMQYQWEWSTNGTNWFNLGSSSNNEYANTGLINQTTQFRCRVTCTGSSQTATSLPVTVTVGGPTAGGTVAEPFLICSGGTSTISTTNSTTSGVTFQWQTSTNNVTFTDIPGATSATYTTPALTSPTYYRVIITCNVGGATATTTSTMVDILPTTAPAVNPSSLSVACGSPANLSATPVTGGTIAWYTQAVGGSPVAMGSNVSVFPSTNTTYYAENSLPAEVTDLGTTATIINHVSVTGDDRGGIATSTNYVYYVGDANTGRFNKSDLTGGTSLPVLDGFFGDQSTGQLWVLGNAFTMGGSFQGFDNVDKLYQLDENLVLTGVSVTLSQSIYLDYNCHVAPGPGYVLLYDGMSSIYKVDINNGNVTTLSTSASIPLYGSENWADYGWAEFDGTDYQIIFRSWMDNNISKYNVTNNAITVLHAYTDLGEMSQIVYDPSYGRMYFHHEYGSEFGGDFSWETLGYLDAVSTGGCGNNSRTPVVVTVTPGPAPTISPAGPINICVGNSTLLTASTGASYQWYLNGNPIAGATSQTYSATLAGNYTVFVTTGIGCTGTSAATVVNVNSGVIASVTVNPSPNDTICAGTIVNFTATPTNGGTNPSYQWKKNGVNVGLNSTLYTGAGLVQGDQIQVVMTVGTNICTTTPTATSTTITMTVQTNTIPSVTVSANPGTTACVDDAVVFTATPTNGGTNPAYQWKKNGVNVGTNSATYTAPAGSLASGDIISVVMTPNLLCSSPATATGTATMTIDPLTTPAVTIAASSLNICQGDQVTFTATDNAPGGTYQWYVNGNPSGPNSSTYTYVPGFNDVVTLDFTPPLAGCYDNITVPSNSLGPITVTPGLPTMATAAGSVTATSQGTLVTVYANLFNFNTNYTIDWYINSSLYTTTTVPYMSYYKGAGQDVIYAICNNTGSGCYLGATTNNVIIEGWATNVASKVATGNIDVYPNPFSKEVVVKGLSDGDKVILFNMLGQSLHEWNVDKATDEYKLNISDIAAGSYLLNIRDKDGNFRDMKKLQKM